MQCLSASPFLHVRYHAAIERSNVAPSESIFVTTLLNTLFVVDRPVVACRFQFCCAYELFTSDRKVWSICQPIAGEYSLREFIATVMKHTELICWSKIKRFLLSIIFYPQN